MGFMLWRTPMIVSVSGGMPKVFLYSLLEEDEKGAGNRVISYQESKLIPTVKRMISGCRYIERDDSSFDLLLDVLYYFLQRLAKGRKWFFESMRRGQSVHMGAIRVWSRVFVSESTLGRGRG
ncbi:hypothetical protein Bca101_020841 [Brassica carinata]